METYVLAKRGRGQEGEPCCWGQVGEGHPAGRGRGEGVSPRVTCELNYGGTLFLLRVTPFIAGSRCARIPSEVQKTLLSFYSARHLLCAHLTTVGNSGANR